MTWTAPEITRADGPFAGPERGILDGFLDWYRATLLVKCAGLTGAQLAERSAPPSALSLLGLVRHMTAVEQSWFRIRFLGEDVPPVFGSHDAAFDEADAAGAPADFAAYEAEVAADRRRDRRLNLAGARGRAPGVLDDRVDEVAGRQAVRRREDEVLIAQSRPATTGRTFAAHGRQ